MQHLTHRQVTVSEASDDELVGLAAEGDANAFTRLVAKHRTRLLALITRILGNPRDAEDVVQEVFTRAWINAPAWRAQNTGRPSYAAWLSRVDVNITIDQTRRARSVPIDSIAEPRDPAALADAKMVSAESAARIRSAIAQLPARQRAALGLTYDAELSNAEAAAAMGTSVGAFELLLVRARRTLRLSLRDDP